MSDQAVDAGVAGGADAAADAGAPPAGSPPADAKVAGGASAKSPGSWIEDIADDSLRQRLTKFAGKPVSELARAYVEAERLIGSDPTSLVKLDDAKKDPVSFLRRLGAPESPEGYKFNLDDLPDEFKAADDLKLYAEIAAKNGLLPEQAESLYKTVATLTAEQAKKAEAEFAERQQREVQTLKEKHGPEFDSLVERAKTAAREFGLTEVLRDAGLGTNPVVIEALAKIGALLGSDAAPGGLSVAAGPHEIEAAARQALANQMKATQAGDRQAAARYAAEAEKLYKRLVGGR